MRTITEETIIRTTPEQIWNFLTSLHKDGNYKRWHPKDHIIYTLQKGENIGEVGSIAYFEEHIGKFTLKLSYTATKATYPNYLEYTAVWPLSWLRAGKGSFRMEQIGNNTTRLTAYAEYGYSVPIIGALLDWLIEKLVKYEDARRHIHEEGEHIKMILEQSSVAE